MFYLVGGRWVGSNMIGGSVVGGSVEDLSVDLWVGGGPDCGSVVGCQ